MAITANGLTSTGYSGRFDCTNDGPCSTDPVYMAYTVDGGQS
jgi:hypothetical protein